LKFECGLRVGATGMFFDKVVTTACIEAACLTANFVGTGFYPTVLKKVLKTGC